MPQLQIWCVVSAQHRAGVQSACNCLVWIITAGSCTFPFVRLAKVMLAVAVRLGPNRLAVWLMTKPTLGEASDADTSWLMYSSKPPSVSLGNQPSCT